MVINKFEHSTIYDFASSVDYAPGAVVSKQVVKTERGNVTLFAFDQGQGLSEHSAPFDALVQVVDGECEITIGGKPYVLQASQSIIMPANIPHALKATQAFKMILTMIRA